MVRRGDERIGMRRFLASLLAMPADMEGPARLPPSLALATLVVMLASSVPFWTGPWLGMIDYPSHLGRYFILAHFDAYPLLARSYQVTWGALANIGGDVVVVGLRMLTGWPVEWISLVQVAVFAVGLVPAVMLLHRALFGSWSWWPLASALLVFNYVLLYGFVNYMAGVPLAIALAAAWILLRERPLALLLPLFGAGALLLFFWHLYALGLYGLMLAAYELTELARARQGRARLFARQVAGALQVLPAVLVFLFLSPTADNAAPGRFGPQSLEYKTLGVYAVLFMGVPWISLLSFATVGAVLGFGLWARRLCATPHGLAMLALLTLAFLAMPFAVLGSGYADYRMPIVIAAVGIAATRWRPLPRGAAMAITAVLLALGLLRIAAMTEEWTEANRRYPEIMQVMRLMEPGRALVTFTVREDGGERFHRRPPVDNAGSLAVFARQAFVSTMFADPGMQPIRMTPHAARLAPPGQHIPREIWLYAPGGFAELDRRVAGYDYLLLYARTPLRTALPPGFRRVDDGHVPGVALFDLRPAR